MNDNFNTRMLLTTAAFAAVAAILVGPASAHVMDIEGGGGYSIGVDEGLSSVQPAVELGGALGTGDPLQPLQRPRADHPEAPGDREVVVGGPAGQLQELLELGARHRLRAEGLVGATGAYRRLNVHRPSVSGPGRDQRP